MGFESCSKCRRRFGVLELVNFQMSEVSVVTVTLQLEKCHEFNPVIKQCHSVYFFSLLYNKNRLFFPNILLSDPNWYLNLNARLYHASL